MHTKLKNFMCVIMLAAVTFLPALMWEWADRERLASSIKCYFLIFSVVTGLLFFPYRINLLRKTGIIFRTSYNGKEALFITIICISFFVLTCTLSGVLFSHLPHVTDSQAHYVQSKIFAEGRTYALNHSLPEFFFIQWFFNSINTFSLYPPGHALLLAIGQLAGVPWVINPLLGVLFLLSVYFLGREIGNVTTGRICLLLSSISPFIIFMSSEYMNHATALLMTTLFVLFYIRTIKFQRPKDALLAGIFAGYLIITRPQCMVIMGPFYAIISIYFLIFHTRTFIRLFMFMGLGLLPFAILFMAYNWLTLGDPLLSGYEFLLGPKVFGGWFNDKIVLADLLRAGPQIGRLSLELFGWPIASLCLVFSLFLLRIEKKYAWILCGSFLFAVSGLVINRYHYTNLFGPRYLYETSGLLIVMCALFIQRFPLLIRSRLRLHLSLPAVRATSFILILGLCIAGLEFQTLRLYKMYSSAYWDGDAAFYDTVHQVDTPAIVFIDKRWHRHVVATLPPKDTSPILFAINLGQQNKALMDQHPERNAYVVHGNIHPLWIEKIK
jgi:hypothetical protein